LAGVEAQAAGAVQQPVAQAFGFAARKLAVEAQGLGVEDEVLIDQHEFEPYGVGVEVAEGEVVQAAVLGGADAVFDAGALAVAALQDGGVLVGLVGEDGLEAIAVGVGERELGAGVRALAADEDAAAVRPSREVQAVGEFGDLAVVAGPAVGVDRGLPCRLGEREDRVTNGFGDVEPDGEPQAPVATELGQLVEAVRPSVCEGELTG